MKSLAILFLAGVAAGGIGRATAADTSATSSARELRPRAIILRRAATPLESLAAREVQRYTYLRTGEVLPIKKGLPSGGCIHVSVKQVLPGPTPGPGLGPQEFELETGALAGLPAWWVLGGDEVGTLYGAYRLAERLGVRFGLDEDAVPDERLAGPWPEMNEVGKPRFKLRGLQPFHDFSTGPDWWNAADYSQVLSQMAKLRLNFIGLHTYPSWNPAAGPEANVWIGLPEDVDRHGNVRFGYEAGVVTTRRGWAVKPFPTSQYASGAGLLFEADDYGPDYLLDCLEWPKTEAAATAMFNRCGDVQQRVFGEARRLGVRTCIGTELPLGVPKALAARLQARGLKPDDPAVVQRLYQGTLLRLRRKSPVDYYWLWTPEVWLSMEPGCRDWEMTSRERIEKDVRIAAAAAESAPPPFGLATCGWRLGTREDARWLEARTPRSWAVSSINTGLGRDPVEPAYGLMTDRERWAIAWAEDDDTAGAHCCTCWDLQLWAARLLANSTQAARYGCQGMMAIHWRTAAISPNIAALARAGWELETPGAPAGGAMPGPAEFWVEWGRGVFGGEPGAEAGRVLGKLDGSHMAINALVRGGAATTDARIGEVFAPLRELESLRPRIRGAGNCERYGYWLKLIGASELRVRTWVLADRLAAKMREAAALKAAGDQREFARQEVLPLRLEVARSYEALIAALVACARSPGELGTISSLESGSRDRVVSAQDPAIAGLLGEPLPAAAAVRTAYRGAPRLFVSGACTQRQAKEPVELRAFVLAAAPCAGLKLYWRELGDKRYRQVAAMRRGRQAYRAGVPGQSPGTAEYYLEATLADGRTVRWPETAPGLSQTVVAW
jgi:hypothetical protein